MPAYLKIVKSDGSTVKGESKADGHVGWIELRSAGFGAANRPSTGDPAPKLPNEISVSKELDSTSPELFRIAALGDKLESITIEFVKIEGKTAKTYVRIEAKDVYITAIGHQGGGKDPLETLVFNSLGIKYTRMKDSKEKEDDKAMWDLSDMSKASWKVTK